MASQAAQYEEAHGLESPMATSDGEVSEPEGQRGRFTKPVMLLIMVSACLVGALAIANKLGGTSIMHAGLDGAVSESALIDGLNPDEAQGHPEFKRYVAQIKAAAKAKASMKQMELLYGLFKQATKGDNPAPEPSSEASAHFCEQTKRAIQPTQYLLGKS